MIEINCRLSAKASRLGGFGSHDLSATVAGRVCNLRLTRFRLGMPDMVFRCAEMKIFS
jgi:hypothetical protein